MGDGAGKTDLSQMVKGLACPAVGCGLALRNGSHWNFVSEGRDAIPSVLERPRSGAGLGGVNTVRVRDEEASN